jgi:hypothetical protein
MGSLSTTHAFLIPVPLVQLLGRMETIDKEGTFHMCESFDVARLSFLAGELFNDISYTQIMVKKNMEYLKNYAKVRTITDARKIVKNIVGGYVNKDGTVGNRPSQGEILSMDVLLGKVEERTGGMSLNDSDSALVQTKRNSAPKPSRLRFN